MLPLIKLTELFHYCFQQFHQTKFLAYCTAVFMLAFSSYWILLLLKRTGRRIPLSGFLFLNAEKSDSNALQSGGIPFSFIALFSIGMLFYWFPYLINSTQARILYFAAFAWLGILFYGYLDDKYEIRPIVKLASQLLLVSIFCLNAANVISPMNSAITFILMISFGTVILNGTNLIDGLDTLSIKVSTVIFLAYILMSAYILCLPAMFIAVSCILIMWAFYFFNREPSKIHLGEVGVSCLGFSYIILSALLYERYLQFNPPIYALTKALLPVVLILIEVTISFSRRIFNGKSPFRGDKFHVHHILREKGFSPSHASSIIAGVYGISLLLAFYIMDPYSSLVSFIILVCLSTSWSLFVGRNHWFRGSMKFNVMDAFIIKEEVKIIPSTTLSDFRIIINDKEGNK